MFKDGTVGMQVRQVSGAKRMGLGKQARRILDGASVFLALKSGAMRYAYCALHKLGLLD
jgi:hypothetical protein